MLLATNRQKKVLQFFNISFEKNLTQGQAGLEIDRIKQIPKKWEKWEKYCFLMDDYNQDSDELKKFNKNELMKVQLPNDWDLEKMKQKSIENKSLQQLKNELNHSPFDNPQPSIEFKGRRFVLSGNFLYGSKKECEDKIKEYGGIISNSISSKTDYLILGDGGSSDYKHGKYGNKVVKAIDLRSNYGVPAIISETHWQQEL